MTRECRLPNFDENRCALFALGRTAIYAACHSLGLNTGDEVLTPAFDCDGALQPFRVLGLRPIFLRSDPYTFELDLSDVQSKITPATRLIHAINHFGFPQPWDALAALGRQAGIPILEDNAYSLFSAASGRPFGSFGDVAIFSLRKNLPLTDGGMLCVNNPHYKVVRPSVGPPWIYPSEYTNALRLLMRSLRISNRASLLGALAAPLRRFVQAPPPLYSESSGGYPEVPSRDRIGGDFACNYLRPMSRLALRQFSGFSASDFAGIAEKKRYFYNRISEGLKGLSGVRVLWPALPEGSAPFSLCVLIDSGRDAILEKLNKKYEVMVWPTLPGAVLDHLDKYPEVELLGRKLLQINLPADMVVKPFFREYSEAIVDDIRLYK
ncbi:MAG: DegT/DnrJ/EryC1/StrS family aminotransferase [Candidatus Omnitrophota bacterium]|nr:DegT/DnrJ/EryC1/StrS family aminotransferase [Candidatus Omnitrophota bacterium]